MPLATGNLVRVRACARVHTWTEGMAAFNLNHKIASNMSESAFKPCSRVHALRPESSELMELQESATKATNTSSNERKYLQNCILWLKHKRQKSLLSGFDAPCPGLAHLGRSSIKHKRVI